jgi:hypothetical protein
MRALIIEPVDKPYNLCHQSPAIKNASQEKEERME